MKNIIVFILFTFLNLSLFSQEVKRIYFDYNWKVTDEPTKASYYRVVKLHDKKRFKVEDYFISGEKQMMGYILQHAKGEKDGFFMYFFKNGVKRAEGNYVKNKLDGKWKYWYKNGNLESIQYYNHKLYRKVYNYETGEGTVIDGKTGVWELYSKDGFLIKNEEYLNGVMVNEKYINIHKDPDYWKEKKYFDYSNRNVRSEREKIGYTFYGKYIDFYPNGKVCRKANFENNYLNGDYEVYYPSGKLKIKGHFKSDIPSVQSHLYEDNIIGTLRKNTKLDFYNGRVGEWLYYTPRGDILRKEFYQNGELFEQQTYDYDLSYYDNGNVRSIIGKQEAMYSGEYFTYYKSGKLCKVFNFEQDKLVGDYLEYYENGKVKISGYYQSADISVFRPVSEEIISDIQIDKTFIDFDAGKHGKWLYYDESGNLAKEEVYRKGRLRREKNHKKVQ